jgi:Tol biopolymer transport system component
MSGDISLAADIEWLSEGVDPHRKACLIFRQSLEPNSAYADAAVHGDGLTSIQYRGTTGGTTREVRANISAPKRVRIEKEGDYISMSVSLDGEKMNSSGGSFKLSFTEPFYVGLGVCAHNADVVEKAKFSNVTLRTIPQKPDSLKKVESTLEIIPINSFDRRVVFHTESHIEAPNWTPDGKTLIYNSGGQLYQIPAEGGTPELIPTGFAKRINNDHGISPDGTQMVISDQTETGKSLIYSIPIDGGEPKKITSKGPSYWHGWSPDGTTLAYCAERNGNYDIYTIPLQGGEETRLTAAEGLDDGPDYSPDGDHIYFNSERSGTMQIWRMKTDGTEQVQITTDEYNDWFAHPSPDGKWIVYVSFGTDVPANSHPPNKDVMLRLMNLETGQTQIMAKLFGGQGTINVPSWSPDSQHVAFVSYRLK